MKGFDTMQLKKFFRVMLFSIMLLAGVILFKPATATYAATTTSSAVTYTITADAQYVNRYTPAKRICGYVKDSNGNPVANANVGIGYYNSRYDLPAANAYIDANYSTAKTDSNGYYSAWGYDSGYYVAFLSSNSDVRATTYALVINR